jgi:hypothetical protein
MRHVESRTYGERVDAVQTVRKDNARGPSGSPSGRPEGLHYFGVETQQGQSCGHSGPPHRYRNAESRQESEDRRAIVAPRWDW